MWGYDYKAYGDYSIHFTYIFNIFVMMTLFDFFNSRMIRNELNIFKGITKSYYFMAIMAIIFLMQIIVLTFTGPAIRVTKWGLDPL